MNICTIILIFVRFVLAKQNVETNTMDVNHILVPVKWNTDIRKVRESSWSLVDDKTGYQSLESQRNVRCR